MKYMMICVALLAGMGQALFAQTAPLEDKQKAVVLFDVRLDRLQESELGKATGLKEKMEQGSSNAEINFSKAVRVFGMISAPESIEQIQQMQASGGQEFPMEFAMRVQFADEGALNDVLNKMKTESTEFTQDGKTYYRPKDEKTGKMCAGQVDSTTMVLGTQNYVTLPDLKSAFSDGVKSSWGNVAKKDDTIRVVVDLAGSKEFVDQLLEMGKGAPPMAQAFLELVPGMNDLRITMDFSGGDLFSLGSNCKDSESANNLKDALDSIFGIAKMGAEANLKPMKDMGMAQVADVASEIMDSLKPAVDGNSVTVNVPKPSGFEDAVQMAAGMFGPMMGGPGGPPPGFGPPQGGPPSPQGGPPRGFGPPPEEGNGNGS
jgi:hypothetical protein